MRGNSIVGSIGVLVEFPNVSGLMDKLGVKLELIKSSPLKAAPNGFEPTSDEARAAMAALIADFFAWFKDLVKERRAMSDDELAKVDDGRVFTGRQGLPLKLADALGGEREAIAWLESDKGVAKDLPVRDYRPKAGWCAPSNCQASPRQRRATRPDLAGARACVTATTARRLTDWSRFGKSLKAIKFCGGFCCSGASVDQIRARAAHVGAQSASLSTRIENIVDAISAISATRCRAASASTARLPTRMRRMAAVGTGDRGQVRSSGLFRRDLRSSYHKPLNPRLNPPAGGNGTK